MSDVAVSADGLPIHFDVYGNGRTALVFVHGGLSNRGHWEKQVSYFASKYKVVTLDLAGHGESGLERKDWTIEAFAEDVVAVADKLELEQFILIGHSFATRVILETARMMPEQVIGLVSADGNFDDIEDFLRRGVITGDESGKEFLATFRADPLSAVRAHPLFQFPDSKQEVAQKVVSVASAISPEVAVGTFRAFWRHDFTAEKLLEVKAPIVAINSDSHSNDIESAQRYGIEMILMSGVGHFLMMEDAVTFNRLLQATAERFVAQGIN